VHLAGLSTVHLAGLGAAHLADLSTVHLAGLGATHLAGLGALHLGQVGQTDRHKDGRIAASLNARLVVNFDLGERFRRPRSKRVAVLGVGAGGARRLPLRGSGGDSPGNFLEIFDAKSNVWGQFARTLQC